MKPVIGCITVTAVLAACAPQGEREGSAMGMAAELCEVAPTLLGVDPTVDPQAALRHAEQLAYLAGPPFGERRPLTVVTDTGPPPVRRFGLSVTAEIQPEACSHLNDTTALQGGNGRIVARIITDGPYPKLGLPPGTSYLWIYDLEITGDSGTAQALIVHANGVSARPRRVRLDYHPEYPSRVWPEARLLFTAQDDELWESCVRFGCCYLEEGRPGDTTASPAG